MEGERDGVSKGERRHVRRAGARIGRVAQDIAWASARAPVGVRVGARPRWEPRQCSCGLCVRGADRSGLRLSRRVPGSGRDPGEQLRTGVTQ